MADPTTAPSTPARSKLPLFLSFFLSSLSRRVLTSFPLLSLSVLLGAPGSSSPAQSTTSTTATSTEKQASKLSPPSSSSNASSPSQSPQQQDEQDTEMQVEPSSELEIIEPEPKEEEAKEGKGKKRKGEFHTLSLSLFSRSTRVWFPQELTGSILHVSEIAPVAKSVAPSKKSKPSSSTSSNAKASTSKSTSLSSASTSSTSSIEVSNDLVGFKSGKLEHKQKSGPNQQVVTSYLIGMLSISFSPSTSRCRADVEEC